MTTSLSFHLMYPSGRCNMLAGCTTNYAISAYYH